MKLRWSHAVFYVRELDPMIAFYTEVLGFEVSDRGPLDPANPAIEVAFLSQVGSDHHQLAFAPVRASDAVGTVDHIAFRVDCLSDVKEMAARLQRDGRAQEITPISHGNAWSVYFKDPEGNTVEVFCDSPFHVQQPQIETWDLAMGEQELRVATERAFGDKPQFGPIDAYYAERRRDGE